MPGPSRAPVSKAATGAGTRFTYQPIFVPPHKASGPCLGHHYGVSPEDMTKPRHASREFMRLFDRHSLFQEYHAKTPWEPLRSAPWAVPDPSVSFAGQAVSSWKPLCHECRGTPRRSLRQGASAIYTTFILLGARETPSNRVFLRNNGPFRMMISGLALGTKLA